MNRLKIATLALLLIAVSALASAQQSRRSGSLTAASASCLDTNCVLQDVQGYGTLGVQITGTITATIQFEQSNDNSNWAAWTVTPVTGGASVTSATATGQWAGTVAGVHYIRVRVSAFTSGPVVVTTQAASARLNSAPGSLGTFATLAVGSGVPTATKPIDATFSANTNEQFLFFNNNAGASAAAEGCFKTDTNVGCISAQGVNSTTEPQRATLYSNCGTGCTSGNAGWDIVGCYGATPTLCDIRFFTNTTDGIVGERARLSAAALTFKNSAVSLGTDGTQNLPMYSFVSDPDTGWYWGGSGAMVYAANATRPVSLTGNGALLASDGTLGYSNAAGNSTTTIDTALSRVSGGVVGVGTGAAGSVAGGMSMATLVVNGVTVTSAVTGVAGSYKVARGSTAFDGANPTTVATGLTTVVSCTATLIRSTALTTGTAFATHATPSGANVDFYAWVLAGTASSGTENFDWVCVGT